MGAHEHNQKLLAGAKTIQQILTAVGICSVVAGGLPRDMHFGLPAKDADICTLLFDMQRDNEMFDAFKDKLDEAGIEWLTYDFGESDEDYNSEDVHQVCAVISLPTLNVDVIFYEDIIDGFGGVRTQTVRDLLAQFDCTLNQFYIAHDGSVGFDGVCNPHHGVVKMLRDVSSEREEKMYEKTKLLVKSGVLQDTSFLCFDGYPLLITNNK